MWRLVNWSDFKLFFCFFFRITNLTETKGNALLKQFWLIGNGNRSHNREKCTNHLSGVSCCLLHLAFMTGLCRTQKWLFVPFCYFLHLESQVFCNHYLLKFGRDILRSHWRWFGSYTQKYDAFSLPELYSKTHSMWGTFSKARCHLIKSPRSPSSTSVSWQPQ